MKDILERIAETSFRDDSWDDLRCRLLDCAEIIMTLRKDQASLVKLGLNMEKIEFQYYYKKAECSANKSTDADCICWHNEGQKPMMDERHNADLTIVEWRIKPPNE